MPERDPGRRAPLLVLHIGSHSAGRELNHPSAARVHAAHLDELTPRALLGILAVRQAVFVVEQQCVYQDIDALDAAPRTMHIWTEDDAGRVVSTLRLIDEDDAGHRIGRVATHPDARRRGHSSALVRRAIELSGPLVVLSAQAYLVAWYSGFGFEERGEHWIEDGIEHVPMRLEVRR
ncbi:MAG TPA: GNAT family N-acetyltransferase [Candidatus Dormibacteraeota bacterium]